MIKDIVDVLDFISISDYIKQYRIDLKYLMDNQDKAKEYYDDIEKQLKQLEQFSINEHYYDAIKNITKLEGIQRIFLSCMNNKDLIDLANKSEHWEEKIYFYGFIKPKKINKE